MARISRPTTNLRSFEGANYPRKETHYPQTLSSRNCATRRNRGKGGGGFGRNEDDGADYENIAIPSSEKDRLHTPDQWRSQGGGGPGGHLPPPRN
ncbi:MAG: hypothetical protein GY820_36410, partial [Gammaproteobacteria bacterium]|nr:hypothetical protein [Gammaproteobacteria bacterium]